MDRDLLPNAKYDRDEVDNVLGPHNYMDVLDLIGGTANKCQEVDTYPLLTATERDLSKGETVFFSEKAVTQHQTSELVVSVRHGGDDLVKDICIDEGVPSVDKILVEEGESKHNRVVGLLYSDLTERSDFSKEVEERTIPSTDDIISIGSAAKLTDRSGCEAGKHISAQIREQIGQDSDDGMDESPNDISEKKFVFDHTVLVDNAGIIGDNSVPFSFDGEIIGETDKQLVSNGNLKTSMEEDKRKVAERNDNVNDRREEEVMPKKPLLVRKLDLDQQSDRLSHLAGTDQPQLQQEQVSTSSGRQNDAHNTKPTKFASSVAPLASEVSLNSNKMKDLSFDRRVESGSITFDFNTTLSSMNTRVERSENTDQPQSAQDLNLSRLQDGGLDSLTGSTRSFFIQHGYGEPDFAGMSSASGPIAYSGPIPFSGSISLRSESSTTSAHSFAFPVLHTEWNSSPVKMARADRRHVKKQCCWRICCFCCKF